jgi:hypothetical protein
MTSTVPVIVVELKGPFEPQIAHRDIVSDLKEVAKSRASSFVAKPIFVIPLSNLPRGCLINANHAPAQKYPRDVGVHEPAQRPQESLDPILQT